jgi:phosphoglucomutase
VSKEEAEKLGLLVMIGSEVDDAYIEALKKVCVNPELSEPWVRTVGLFTHPFMARATFGTKNSQGDRFENVLVVKEQEKLIRFSTVTYPNPRRRPPLKLPLSGQKGKCGYHHRNRPDADRVGVVVRDSEGEYITLTGNQTGCLLLEYILSKSSKETSFRVTPLL